MRIVIEARILEGDESGVATVLGIVEHSSTELCALGLSLAEGRTLLRHVQEVVVQARCRELAEHQSRCAHCGQDLGVRGFQRFTHFCFKLGDCAQRNRHTQECFSDLLNVALAVVASPAQIGERCGQAQSDRVELRIAREQVEAESHGLSAARSNVLPTVAAVGDYGFSGNEPRGSARTAAASRSAARASGSHIRLRSRRRSSWPDSTRECCGWPAKSPTESG